MIKDIEKLNVYGLREYMTNPAHYFKTKMKKHQVLLYTCTSSDPHYASPQLRNMLTEGYFPFRQNNSGLRRTPFDVNTQAQVICYHDTAFCTTFLLTNEINNLVRLNNNESVQSKCTYLPNEPSLVLHPTVATWVDTKQEYWVMFLPITDELLTLFNKYRIDERQSSPEFILSGIVLVFADLNGTPNMQEPMWLTINQFKSIFNYASLKTPVAELEKYILAKQMSLCKINSKCAKEYKERFKATDVTEEHVKELFASNAYPIRAEDLKVTYTRYHITGGKSRWFDYSLRHKLESSNKCTGYSITFPYYPAYPKQSCDKYGSIFRNPLSIIQTLKNIRKRGKTIPADALIYATLAFDSYLYATRNKGYKKDYPMWYGTNIAYVPYWGIELLDCQARLDFGTPNKVIIYIGCWLGGKFTLDKVCELDVDDYIAMLNYIQGTIEGSYIDLGKLISDILGKPAMLDDFSTRAKQLIQNPSAFVLGNKGLTAIFSWLKIRIISSDTASIHN